MPRSKTDPLVAAIIAKIPSPGTDWSVDQQLALLNALAMAFGLAYGGDVASRLGAKPATFAPVAAPVSRAKPTIGHPYVIDEGGFVKNTKTGKRVNANDIDGTIFDTRGQEADLRAIIWADNSTGLNGKDLTISA